MILFQLNWDADHPWLCIEVRRNGCIAISALYGFFETEANAHAWGKANFNLYSVGRVYE